MQSSGATSEQMGAAMTMMQTKIEKHNVIDHVEDNVDTLIKRLENQIGGKVKILTEEEEQAEKAAKEEREREI